MHSDYTFTLSHCAFIHNALNYMLQHDVCVYHRHTLFIIVHNHLYANLEGIIIFPSIHNNKAFLLIFLFQHFILALSLSEGVAYLLKLVFKQDTQTLQHRVIHAFMEFLKPRKYTSCLTVYSFKQSYHAF
jgi:hypothetical protein